MALKGALLGNGSEQLYVPPGTPTTPHPMAASGVNRTLKNRNLDKFMYRSLVNNVFLVEPSKIIFLI